MEMNQANQGKIAAQAALEYFNDFYENEQFVNIRLEEIEKEGSNWLITLGFDEVPTGLGMLGRKRSYKIFKIDKTTFGVESMKIRKFDINE